MTATWDDVNARVRGLATHFPTEEQLAQWVTLTDVNALARVINEAGMVHVDAATAGDIEVATRRWAARQMEFVSRWAARRVEILTVFFEDEDRRSIRALVRGAYQGVDQDSRIAALIPTPALDIRALEELARCASPRQVAALLLAWHNPYGPTVLAGTRGIQPDLLDFEVALARTYFERSRKAARRDPIIRMYVEQSIDVANIWTAFAIGGRAQPFDAGLFLDGGAVPAGAMIDFAKNIVDVPDFRRAFPDTWLARLAKHEQATRIQLERAFLAEQLSLFEQMTRTDPLSAASIVVFFLRLRSIVSDINRIAWRLDLRSPRVTRVMTGAHQ